MCLAEMRRPLCSACSTENIPGTDNDVGQYVLYTVRQRYHCTDQG